MRCSPAASAAQLEAGQQVVCIEVGVVGEALVAVRPGSKQVEQHRHRVPGLAVADTRVPGNPIETGHDGKLEAPGSVRAGASLCSRAPGTRRRKFESSPARWAGTT